MSCEKEVSSWLLLIIFYIHYHKAYITISMFLLYYLFFSPWYKRTLLWDFNDDAFIVSWEKKGEANEWVRKLNKDADMESDMWVQDF